MFGIFKKKEKIEGYLRCFSLEYWWLTTFSESEQRYIENTIAPNEQGSYLTKGGILGTSQTKLRLIGSLATRFGKEDGPYLFKKIMDEAEKLLQENHSVTDAHFVYQQKLETWYKNHGRWPNAVEETKQACRQQIAISERAAKKFRKEYEGIDLPRHAGYQQLSRILEEEENFTEVVKLCHEAQVQGWAGDWKKRAERCRKKMQVA